MNRRLAVWVVVAVTVSLLGGPVIAAEQAKQPAKEPDAVLKLSEGSVGVGIGWSWSKGELLYKGQTYKIKVKGLSVIDLGIAEAKAVGRVTSLKSLDDFSGHYTALDMGATVVKGGGLTVLKNNKGVKIEMKSETKGVDFKLAAEGLKLELEK